MPNSNESRVVKGKKGGKGNKGCQILMRVGWQRERRVKSRVVKARKWGNCLKNRVS